MNKNYQVYINPSRTNNWKNQTNKKIMILSLFLLKQIYQPAEKKKSIRRKDQWNIDYNKIKDKN